MCQTLEENDGKKAAHKTPTEIIGEMDCFPEIGGRVEPGGHPFVPTPPPAVRVVPHAGFVLE
jgi:hypothetical protein